VGQEYCPRDYSPVQDGETPLPFNASIKKNPLHLHTVYVTYMLTLLSVLCSSVTRFKQSHS